MSLLSSEAYCLSFCSLPLTFMLFLLFCAFLMGAFTKRTIFVLCVVMEQSGVEQRWQEKVPTVPSYTIILSCQITHQPVGTAVHLLEPTTLLKSSQLLMAFFSTELLSGYSAVWSYHSKRQATEALILTFVYHFTLLWYMDHVIILTNFFLAFSFFCWRCNQFWWCHYTMPVSRFSALLEFTILNIKLPLKNTCNTCTRFLW